MGPREGDADGQDLFEEEGVERTFSTSMPPATTAATKLHQRSQHLQRSMVPRPLRDQIMHKAGGERGLREVVWQLVTDNLHYKMYRMNRQCLSSLSL